MRHEKIIHDQAVISVVSNAARRSNKNENNIPANMSFCAIFILLHHSSDVIFVNGINEDHLFVEFAHSSLCLALHGVYNVMCSTSSTTLFFVDAIVICTGPNFRLGAQHFHFSSSFANGKGIL